MERESQSKSGRSASGPAGGRLSHLAASLAILADNLRISVDSLLRNRLRSLLTLLGLFIGIGAVVTIMSAGEGLKNYFRSYTEKIGENTLYAVPQRISMSGRIDREAKAFKLRDVEFLRLNSTTLKQVEGLAMGQATVKFQEKTRVYAVFGVEPSFWHFEQLEIIQGRNFTPAELKGAARVVILGNKVPEDLFPKNLNPVGAAIKIGGEDYRVIGLIEKVGQRGPINVDKSLYLPLYTVQRRITGNDEIVTIYLKAKSPEELGVETPKQAVELAKAEVTRLLRVSRRIRDPSKDDFIVMDISAFVDFVTNFVNILVLVFGVIAFIALVVGGVGVMNVMLVSVTERRREIGLRKAVGAHPLVIMSQFLMEAGILSLGGGLGGILLGYLGGWGLAAFISNLPGVTEQIVPSIPLVQALLATGIAVAVGIIFGTWPAVRAARLDPVVALRT